MRNKNSVTIADALDQMVADLKLSAGIHEVRVKKKWKELMGAPIARYTSSVSLKAGKLYIHVTSAPLKNELFYSRDKIKELFNKELGAEVIKTVILL
ncbi:MAG: DUF721 domain-containing protein [Bacteroidetes bacterium]|nr:DUF721 domain-containing protein [Bacteroidota bacterium]